MEEQIQRQPHSLFSGGSGMTNVLLYGNGKIGNYYGVREGQSGNPWRSKSPTSGLPVNGPQSWTWAELHFYDLPLIGTT